MNKSIVVLFFSSIISMNSANANLIVNNDFNLGDTGFDSDYINSHDLHTAGTYAVGSDPFLFHSAAASHGDHTTGSGLMLMLNGSTIFGQTVWEQTVSVALGGNYIFSGFATTWGRYNTDFDPSPPTLQFYINNVRLDSGFTIDAENNIWTQFSFLWSSDFAQTATLRIVDANLEGGGNDFSMDDFYFVSNEESSVAEPGTYALSLLGLMAMAAGSFRRKVSKKSDLPI